MWTESDIANLIKGVNRIADAYERMASAVEQKRVSSGSPTAGSGEAKSKKPKGDILTITDRVASFGTATDRSGNPVKTKVKPDGKGGNEYWKLKLVSGFQCSVFSSTQAVTCSKAYDENLTLIVEYTKTDDGKYNNIESVKIGAASPEREPGSDDGWADTTRPEGAPF